MKRLLATLTILLFFILPIASIADPPGPPGQEGGAPGGGPTPVGAPIDGGLSILLAMGAGYGGLKYYKKRKKEKDEEAEAELE